MIAEVRSDIVHNGKVTAQRICVQVTGHVDRFKYEPKHRVSDEFQEPVNVDRNGDLRPLTDWESEDSAADSHP